jgi:hypothetical protein
MIAREIVRGRARIDQQKRLCWASILGAGQSPTQASILNFGLISNDEERHLGQQTLLVQLKNPPLRRPHITNFDHFGR